VDLVNLLVQDRLENQLYLLYLEHLVNLLDLVLLLDLLILLYLELLFPLLVQ
jgi:hypothetical protein